MNITGLTNPTLDIQLGQGNGRWSFGNAKVWRTPASNRCKSLPRDRNTACGWTWNSPVSTIYYDLQFLRRPRQDFQIDVIDVGRSPNGLLAGRSLI
jgi:hypothetical protein